MKLPRISIDRCHKAHKYILVKNHLKMTDRQLIDKVKQLIELCDKGEITERDALEKIKGWYSRWDVSEVKITFMLPALDLGLRPESDYPDKEVRISHQNP